MKMEVKLPKSDYAAKMVYFILSNKISNLNCIMITNFPCLIYYNRKAYAENIAKLLMKLINLKRLNYFITKQRVTSKNKNSSFLPNYVMNIC